MKKYQKQFEKIVKKITDDRAGSRDFKLDHNGEYSNPMIREWYTFYELQEDYYKRKYNSFMNKNTGHKDA